MSMIWKNNPTPEGINSFHQSTLVNHLDITFTEVGPNYLKATMPVDERTKQPYGVLHGGASVALAETLGSVASVLIQENPLKTKSFGVEINANHVRSAKSGLVTGTVSPVKIGRTLQVWNIEIHDEEGELCCVSRLTTMIKS